MRTLGAVAALFVAVLPSVGFGQRNGQEPVKTTLCELKREPKRFNQKFVEFRSEFVSRFQWEGFVDASCSAKIQVGVLHVFDELKPEQGEYAFTRVGDDNTHPERLKWKPIELLRPVHLKADENYRTFRQYADTKFKWPDGGVCQDCPLYRLEVTAIARFDYFETQTVSVRANPQTKAFHCSAGDSDAPLLRLVLQSVTDVSATPVKPSVYSDHKRRDVTLEEAHELVKAFQKDHGEGGYGLEKYAVQEYAEFQFFQAVPDPPRGRLHYAVDLTTGDVWNAVFCEHLTSSSLVKLQAAIRNRIGLTKDEYKKARRQGPMCETGMPRVGK